MTPTIYSIGYRGLTPATLWRWLRGAGVTVLVDVRPNPRRALMWGSNTLRRGADWRGVSYLPLSAVADLRELAATHAVALLSGAPVHRGSQRESVARSAGLRVVAVNPRPMQPELFDTIENRRAMG